jgi:hypothetical protein
MASPRTRTAVATTAKTDPVATIAARVVAEVEEVEEVAVVEATSATTVTRGALSCSTLCPPVLIFAQAEQPRV